MNYKVGDLDFYSFDEVVAWANNEHGIELWEVLATEEEKQQACRELEVMIADSDRCMGCGCTSCGSCGI